MNSILQWVIASAFAVVAAALNWVYLASQTTPDLYVAVRSNLDQGQSIEDADLFAVPIPGDPQQLKSVLIPYRNRSILFGARSARNYVNGDMFFARDLVAPLDEIQWDVIGPFELISVAERFKQPSEERPTMTDSIGRNTITIAVDAGFDRDTSRLLEAITSDSRVDASKQRTAIVAVQVVPSSTSLLKSPDGDQSLILDDAQPTSAFNRRQEVVYQTVSLEGIASVPGVLLEGEFIRFVVPRQQGAR